MSLYFLSNNFHFAFELSGAVAFLMAAWLTFDTYSFRKDGSVLTRAIGLSLIALWQVIHALSVGSDALSYIGFAFYLIGLVLVVGSLSRQQKLSVQSVLILPAFAVWAPMLTIFAGLLLLLVAFLSWRKIKQEFNKTWVSYVIAFLLLGVAALLGAFEQRVGTIFFAEHLLKLIGFGFLVRWVWQFLALRVRESLVLIFISVALFLSTLVTLAFSTILIGQITQETQANLLTDARVLDLTVESLKGEASAKTQLAAMDSRLALAISKNDFVALESAAEAIMEEYQLGFLTITDVRGDVLMRAHALSKRGDSLLGERALEEALGGKTFVTVEESPVERLSIRAGAPVYAKEKVVGAVIAGYPLDNAFVDGMKRVTGLEMFVYKGDTSVAATAFAEDGRTRLTGIQLNDTGVVKKVLEEGKEATAQVDLHTQPYLTGYLPLRNADSKIIGMIGAGKPQQDILDIANATNRLTLITVLIIMIVLSVPMYLFTKRLTI